MKKLIALASLLPVLAFGQGVTTLAAGAPAAGKVLASFAFGTPGCYASGTGGVNITRTTAAQYWDGGSWQSCASGQYRVAPEGLLVEPTRNQYVLNNSTHPKTSEATASLGTGSFIAWHEGTGTMTLAAGTATVTGLSCSAVAAGTTCSFTVTVAGTMSITTTAGTTAAQIENGTYRTSLIATAGGMATRNIDVVTATIPSLPQKWCIAVTATPEGGRAWTNGAAWLWAVGTWGSLNSAALYEFTGISFRIYDASTDVRKYAAWTDAGSHRWVACSNAGSMSVAADGSSLTLSSSGPGSGAMPTPQTTLNIGNGGSAYGGFLKGLKICSAKSWRECK